MTKSSTKAVINQSFPATYNFYRIRVEGTNRNDCIHGAVTHILSDDFNINCIKLGVNEAKAENMKKSLRSNDKTFWVTGYFG